MLAVGCWVLISSPVDADVATETVGQIEALPPASPHWAGVIDLILERLALVDLDSGQFLGILNGGYGPFLPMYSARRNEFFLPATYFSRRTHGERTDVVEIHDAGSLKLVSEIVVPPKRSVSAVALGHSALTDDERFVALFNWTTATSLSIVDMENRTFVGEIEIPGCSLVYAAGTRRFFSLCGDGSALVLTIDDAGHEVTKVRSKPFFNPQTDPITEKAVRRGDRWYFASFEGMLYGVDASGDELKTDKPWPLFSDGERQENWRIGGLQHLALHEKSGHLFSLVHRGPRDTHKEPGEEVWVYDLNTQKRLQRIKLVNSGLTVMGFPIEFGATWIWPFNRIPTWLLDHAAPALVTAVEVTQDDQPLLFTASQFTGSIGVYNATTGSFLRRVLPTGWTSDILVAPWRAKAAP